MFFAVFFGATEKSKLSFLCASVQPSSVNPFLPPLCSIFMQMDGRRVSVVNANEPSALLHQATI